MILRIEDTDQNRLVPDAAEKLIAALSIMGLCIDEGPGIGGEYGPYTQSERLQIYRKYADELLKNGHAYHCFCSSDTLTEMREEQTKKGEFVKYDRRCLSLSKEEIETRLDRGDKHVLRLKMPDNRIFTFEDVIRGKVEMNSDQSDDQVIIKSDGFPTYHLAAVVDDHLMEISHVIRGEEWLSSTPKHLWLYECLGWTPPKWVHLPLILNTDRSKLSKRMNDVSVESYLEKGYLKEAIVNFIALLGWHAAEDRELYSMEELCHEFSIERVNKAGAVFDLTKLDWMNGMYLRSLPIEQIVSYAIPFFATAGIELKADEKSSRMISVARERVTLLPELVDYCRSFLSPSEITPELIAGIDREKSRAVIEHVLNKLSVSYPNDDAEVDTLIKEAITELGIKGKAFYAPLRFALLSQEHGPDLPSIFFILGESEVLKRLSSFREVLA